MSKSIDEQKYQAIFKLRTTHEVEHNDNQWTTEFVYSIEDVEEAIGNLIAQAEKESEIRGLEFAENNVWHGEGWETIDDRLTQLRGEDDNE